MRLPEEIKRGILCDVPCKDCAYRVYAEGESGCSEAVTNDTIAYIQQLESRLAQAERERDAAVHDLHVLFSEGGKKCMICGVTEAGMICLSGCDESQKWRGVCEENTKEEK